MTAMSAVVLMSSPCDCRLILHCGRVMEYIIDYSAGRVMR